MSKNIKINAPASSNIEGSITLPTSKSISNRALIIKALADNEITIDNLSISNDTELLLNLLNSNSEIKDCEMAGTTFRFLTSFLAITDGNWILTGSNRMKERPISQLVEALKLLGADIQYLESEGYPPLAIVGKKLNGGSIELPANISSQYVSALMMIAPALQSDLNIQLKNKIASLPYIKMTANIMQHFGASLNVDLKNNLIVISNTPYSKNSLEIEGDWSSASYYYSILALADEGSIELSSLHNNSWQGDSIVSDIYFRLGVSTYASENKVFLEKTKHKVEHLEYDFSDCPDLAQTVICTCVGLGIKGTFSGMETLRIKETDRILALQNELAKLNWILDENNNIFELYRGANLIQRPLKINTYNDHRMAMSFAPLCIILGEMEIENHEVVKKSNPEFWAHLAQLGFQVKEVEPK